MEENSIEIKDVENFRGKTDDKFSHQQLVMSSMKRVIDIGTHELYEGFNETIEDKYGNKKIIYKENTKKAFIEAIETCEMVMSCDLDEEAEDNIKKIKDSLEEERTKLLKEQIEWFNKLPENTKIFYGKIMITSRAFNSNLPHYYQFQEFQIKKYREIFSELTKLTKRLDFFASEDFEA